MKDPVETRASDEEDLYDVATWEPRTALDRLAVKTHRTVLRVLRALLVGLGLAIFVLILFSGVGALVVDNPFVLGLVVLSIIPAGLLAVYIYVTDITTREPPSLVAITFVLAVLFAGFAAVVNYAFSDLETLGLVGILLFYFLIVGPVEESVKLLAVRLHAYRDSRFDTVIDGAVYGAAAGLGFATIENAIYITQNIEGPSMLLAQASADVLNQFGDTLDSGGEIAAVRGLAGPGHVIYSAFAGYYLGLAKFNPDDAGPIVAKGLLIAAFIHATYNTLVSIVPGLVGLLVPGVPLLVLFFGFVVVYDGLFLYVLYRKLRRYRRTYRRAHRGPATAPGHESELTEFDPDSR